MEFTFILVTVSKQSQACNSVNFALIMDLPKQANYIADTKSVDFPLVIKETAG